MKLPDVVTKEMLKFLDALRESGVTNMWGAQPYILDEFPDLTDKEAGKVLTCWIRSFGERHATA